MMLGYVHDTTKIWRIWDPEHRKVVNCSDIDFDENQTAYMSCIDNENDALGLPELEPIYAEEHVNPRMHGALEVSQPSAVENTSEDPRLHAAPGKIQPSAECISGEPRLHAAPGATQLRAEKISRESRLHVAPGTIQPRAERANLTPDEVMDSAPRMDHQTPDEVVDPAISRATVVRTTGQEPGKRVTRSQRTKKHVALVAVPDLAPDPCQSTRSQRTKKHVALVAVPDLVPDPRSQREALNSPLQREVLNSSLHTPDPRSYYHEALNSPLYKHWKSAMREEYASLMENDAFTFVKHTNSKPIGCKWVFETKNYPDGTLRYEARLVIK
jgi:hypothetical protein